MSKLDIQLVIRSSDYNCFQEKIRKGALQIYEMGWATDYPDPVNMLFLFLSSEGKITYSGEDISSCVNPAFDVLFKEMKNQGDTPERLAILQQMTRMIQDDAPWIFSFHPKSYVLSLAWLKNHKLSAVGHNALKYQRVDAEARKKPAVTGANRFYGRLVRALFR